MHWLRLIPAAFALWCCASSATTVSGSVAYPSGTHIPSSARLEVRIEDISIADASARSVGRAVITPVGPTPAEFAIDVADAKINPSHRYSMRAQIFDGDVLLYTSKRAYPVLTSRGDTNVPSVIVERVARGAHVPDRPLIETYWKLIALGSEAHCGGDLSAGRVAVGSGS